jgi:hypothetical protein
MKSDIIEAGSASSILDQGQFEFYTISEHGAEFQKGMPQAAWLAFMERALTMYESSHRLHIRTMFIVGDGLMFGESEYGEEYAQAIDMTRKVMQLSEKSIKNAAWICSSIAPSLRRETLTFAHHEVVAPLVEAEQREFLDQAESENLTVSALKKAVKKRHPKTARGKTRKSGADLQSEEGLQIAGQKIAEWLAENEKTLTKAQLKQWQPITEPIFKFHRRQWQSGHKR